MFKIGDKVVVDGYKEGTVQDIYTRVYFEDGEKKTQVSYRLKEKDFWYEEFSEKRVGGYQKCTLKSLKSIVEI